MQPAPHIETVEQYILFIGPLVSLLLVGLLGIYRKRSIVGPPRIAPPEGAKIVLYAALVGVSGMFFFTGASMALFQGHVGNFDPQYQNLLQRLDGQGIQTRIAHFVIEHILNDSSRQQMIYIASVCGQLLSAAIVVWTMTTFREYGARRMGINPGRIPPGLVLGLIAFVIIEPWVGWGQVATRYLLNHFNKSENKVHDLLLMWPVAGSTFRLVIILSAVVVAPIWEEIFFRGLVQTLLARLFGAWKTKPTDEPLPVGESSTPQRGARISRILGIEKSQGAPARSWPTWLAIICTSLFFMSWHAPWSWLMIFTLSMALGYVYERTGNLWSSIFLHSIFNGAQVLMFMASH